MQIIFSFFIQRIVRSSKEDFGAPPLILIPSVVRPYQGISVRTYECTVNLFWKYAKQVTRQRRRSQEEGAKKKKQARKRARSKKGTKKMKVDYSVVASSYQSYAIMKETQQ